MIGKKNSQGQPQNHFIHLIKEHFNRILRMMQVPQGAKVQRSWAKENFQNPMLSMVHIYVHFFYCSVLNIECVEGKKNSLSLLNYTCLRSWCILVTAIKKKLNKCQLNRSGTLKGYLLKIWLCVLTKRHYFAVREGTFLFWGEGEWAGVF